MNVQDATIISERPRKTRAQVIRARVQIRLALNTMGPVIADLLKENGIVFPDCDWSHVFPHWLIATVDDAVIGCVQVIPSKPIGYCEFLFTRPSVSFKLRAIAILKLTEQAWGTLMMAGCSYIAGNVEVKNKKFADILKKLNFVAATESMVMVKRLVGEPMSRKEQG